MKILLRVALIIISYLAPLQLGAQIYEGYNGDSTLVRFTTTPTDYIADTAVIPVWMIGKTHKSFFTSDTAGVTAIMTDTVNYYPTNTNNWFALKIPMGFNTIVDFWHRYKTDSGRDGGMVELSIDHGATWENIMGPCNSDGTYETGIRTYNFYSFADTLSTGEPVFSGTSDSTRYSRLQIFNGYPEKSSSGTGCHIWVDTFYLRFRFTSDSVADTLDGWMIDSIKVERDIYPGLVPALSNTHQLPVSPNPSATGLFTLPALKNEDELTITISNMLGQKLLEIPYKRNIDLSSYPSGMYLYKVSGSDDNYSGKLIYR